MRGTPAGDLRHRITIQRPKPHDAVPLTRDALGSILPGQEYLSKHYAKIEPLSARETLMAGSVSMGVTHKITVRYQCKIANAASGTKIEYAGRKFDVSSVIDPENAHVELIFLCTEQRA